jgi:hypothetical protein
VQYIHTHLHNEIVVVCPETVVTQGGGFQMLLNLLARGSANSTLSIFSCFGIHEKYERRKARMLPSSGI